MFYLNCLCIALLFVAVLDLTTFYDEFSGMIRSWFTQGKFRSPIYVKPFSCSLCMTHHVCFIYMLCVHSFSLVNWCYIMLLAIATPFLALVLRTLLDFASKALEEIREYFNIN